MLSVPPQLCKGLHVSFFFLHCTLKVLKECNNISLLYLKILYVDVNYEISDQAG